MFQKTPYFIFTLFVANQILFAAELSVSPSYFELSGTGGTTIQDTVIIYNTSTEPLPIRLYVGDFWYDKEGKRTFPEPGTTSYSSASWIALSEKEVNVPARGQKSIPFSFTISPTNPPSAYSTIFVEKLNPEGKSGELKSKVNLSLRIAIPVLYQSKDYDPARVILNNIKLSKPSKFKPLVLNFKIENKDRSYIFPEGHLSIVRAKDKSFVYKEEIKKDKVLLPAQKSLIEVAVAMEPQRDKYEGLLTVFYGKDKSLTHTFNFSIP